MITVRWTTDGDAEGVRSVLAASELDSSLADRAHYERLIAVDESGAVQGFLDGLFDLELRKVVERAVMAHPGPQSWGNWMVVTPDARGHGVGRALIRAFVTEAQQRGHTFFAVMVSLADDPTDRVAFFHRCGLRDLVPDTPGDVLGAPITDILSVTAHPSRTS